MESVLPLSRRRLGPSSSGAPSGSLPVVVRDAATGLPSWAQAKQVRDILQAIIAERPEATDDRCSNWGHRTTVFHSASCTALRRYHEKLQVEALATDDASYFAGMPTTNFGDLMVQERPDELIERLLHEGLPLDVRWAA